MREGKFPSLIITIYPVSSAYIISPPFFRTTSFSLIFIWPLLASSHLPDLISFFTIPLFLSPDAISLSPSMVNRGYAHPDKLDHAAYHHDQYETDPARTERSLLASAGLDNKIYVWFPATGDKYREYELDPTSSQVRHRLWRHMCPDLMTSYFM